MGTKAASLSLKGTKVARATEKIGEVTSKGIGKFVPKSVTPATKTVMHAVDASVTKSVAKGVLRKAGMQVASVGIGLGVTGATGGFGNSEYTNLEGARIDDLYPVDEEDAVVVEPPNDAPPRMCV